MMGLLTVGLPEGARILAPNPDTAVPADGEAMQDLMACHGVLSPTPISRSGCESALTEAWGLREIGEMSHVTGTPRSIMEATHN